MTSVEYNNSVAAIENCKLAFNAASTGGQAVSHGRMEEILDNFKQLLGSLQNNLGEGGLSVYPNCTIATLPTVTAPDNGKFIICTDATTATNGSPPATGGGSIIVLCKVVAGAWACQ